jgi:transcriptional regulator with XRE-family HTH domain
MMTYEGEHIATLLKKTREAKGLSQRELAKRSGVPQSHISKIEANAVDLRVSSLVTLAHALDLEITLIPRKAAPAVNSIVRSTSGQHSHANTGALRELHRAQRALENLSAGLFESGLIHRVQKQLAEMQALPNLTEQLEPLRKARTSLEAIKGTPEMSVLEKISDDAQRLRNALAHGGSQRELPSSKPAYSLDDEEEDDHA